MIKTINLSKIKRFSKLHFPFYLPGPKKSRIKFDVLTRSNSKQYFNKINKWNEHLDGLDNMTKKKFSSMTERSGLRAFKLPNRHRKTFNPKRYGVLFFATINNNIEGVTKFSIIEQKRTWRSFTGIAPWNLNKKNPEFKPHLIADSLHRLFLLFCLHVHNKEKDDSYICSMAFETKRGVRFGKRLFHIRSNRSLISDFIAVALNKQGIISYLNDDLKGLKNNMRLYGKGYRRFYL